MRDRSRGGIGLTIASDQRMTQRSPGERRKLPPTRDLRLRKATLTNVAVDDVGLRAYTTHGLGTGSPAGASQTRPERA
jgi:hypothetical protein